MNKVDEILITIGRIEGKLEVYASLSQRVPVVAVDYVFVSPLIRQDAAAWIEANRAEIIKPKKEEE